MDQSQGNPFAGILERIKARKAQESQASAPAPTPMMQGADEKMVPPDQTKYGQNTKVTGLLTGAIKSIDQAITESTDPNKIKILRSINTLIARVLEKENAEQGGEEGMHMMPDGSMMKNSEMSGM